jgi:hypothetical protein
MKLTTSIVAVGLAFAGALAAAPAQAQNRTYTAVSAANLPSLPSLPGPGTSCGSTQSPCRTLQAAVSVTAVNGVIDVLSPGEYGPLTISHAVTIQGHGWATVTATSGGTGITINAGNTDKINLRGLLIDGGGSGSNGISFTSGASLNVQGCQVRNFAGGIGIQFVPGGASLLFVSDTVVSDNSANGGEGVFVGNGTAFLTRLQADNDYSGIVVQGSSAINVTVTDSTVTGNAGQGITAISLNGSQVYVAVRTSNISGNGTGIAAGNTGAIIHLAQSTVTGNQTGWTTSNTAGLVGSAEDNLIDDNPSGNSAPPGPLYK